MAVPRQSLPGKPRFFRYEFEHKKTSLRALALGAAGLLNLGTEVPESAFVGGGRVSSIVRRKPMKALISALAMALALAFTGPAFAGDVASAKNAADCSKAGGIWNAATNTCSLKKM